MIPNIRHLQAFHEVARLGSISSASRRLHLTQPAVTQAVANVERYFGAALFIRSSTGIRLTDAGKICTERIGRALDHLREGLAELLRRPVRGQGNLPARHLTTAQLQALIALVEHRSFTRAARAVHVSQPTLHRAARTLERELEATLFEKTSFGVTPTRHAEKLARRAQLAFAEFSQARADIDAWGGGESGSTVIGTMPLARSFLVPKALIRFTLEHPEHAVSIVEGTYEYLIAALQSGQADFLIGALRDAKSSSDVVQELLFEDPLSIVVRAGHPLASRRRLRAADLSRFTWIAPRASSPLRAHFDALFISAGFEPPRKPVECNSLTAARALLMESDRMMLSSAQQIHYELKAGLLVALPHPAGDVVRHIGLTLRRDWHPTRAQARLLEFVRKEARNSGRPARPLRNTSRRNRDSGQ